MNKICIFFILFFSVFVLRGQIKEELQDTIKTGYSTGKIQIKNPKSVLDGYTYDPVKDRYIYTKTVDGFNIDYPLILTPKEYEKLILKQSMRDYFKEKADAIEGKKEGTEEVQKNLLPRYYVNSNIFETIFGSNTIDIKPTGSVEIDLGVRYTKQDNPAFTVKNRSNTSLDFNQRISLGLTGKIGTRVGVTANYDTQSTFSFQNLFKITFDPNLASIDPKLGAIADDAKKKLGDANQLINDVKNIGNDIKSYKPKFTPKEDGILQALEVGNVNMPLNSTLIKGTESLFGVKTKMQFGPTTITGVFSEQKSQTKNVVAQGGGTIQEFNLYALDYDNDRHYFLSQYFRNRYDAALKKYPFIDSRVQITRIEVWITNKQNRVNTIANNSRNIIALQDLGEGQLPNISDNKIVVINPIPSNFFVPSSNNPKTGLPSDNKNNLYDPNLIDKGTGLLNINIRQIVTATTGFTGVNPNEGTDYVKLENARKLNPNEFTFNPQLGYISLQQRLNSDEVLAVAYQYTIGDELYQVGEFANDGVPSTSIDEESQNIETNSLILKLLKTNLTSINEPIWNLMMKNVYQIPGGYQLKKEDFKFNILYTDPSPVNYITSVPPSSFPSNPSLDNQIEQTPLIKVFNLDKLNFNNDPQEGGDGFFDFIPGLTIDPQNGRIIFTTKEPFGELLFNKLTDANTQKYDDPTSYNLNQKKYVYESMYRSTKTGALQNIEKNKFLLKGKFKSSTGDGIPIGSFNVPQGSVVVTAGGRKLIEGVDYSVNYQLGRVQILDPSLQASNTPIEISSENNSVFGQQTRRFVGVNVEHKVSEKFTVGATFLNLSEKPLTTKSNYGQESVNNSIFGVNTNFSTEIPFFTRLANKLPNIDTDAPSNLSIRGEIAFLKPNSSKNDRFNGESTLYVDDFEGSQSNIDLRAPYSWNLSSTPVKNENSTYDFNENNTNLTYGYKRAKLAWYTIDPVFYTNKPEGISNDDLSLNSTRRIFNQELYPKTDIPQGQSQVLNTLDLSYYPSERGPYNNNPNYYSNPENNFGGIMRAVNLTDFEQANVDHIQFWVLDPYVGNGQTPNNNVGKLYLNLGEISEDILKDGHKQYENGLGSEQDLVKPRQLWGDVPASQSLIYAFDNNADNRTNQDTGLDGLNDGEEQTIYTNFAGETDPSADNYTFFLNTKGNVLERYKNYNGVEGNSNIDANSPNRASSNLPDVEDVNKDNTMTTMNAYYEYSIDLKPNMVVGDKYVTDVREVSVTLANGTTSAARWIQLKVPVFKPENTIGNISDFRSIRFMRMFMTGFSEPITIRMGALDLVRDDWRRYGLPIASELSTGTRPSETNTIMEVLAVNVQENGQRCPINYVSPPNVVREQLYNNNSIINENEQSLSLRISGDGLAPYDSRAVLKNVNVDMRQFKRLKMFLHAESLLNETPLADNAMVAFIRIGNDYTDNFYEINVPLQTTQFEGVCSNLSANTVWPDNNNLDIALDLLTKIKVQAMHADPSLLKNGIFYKNISELDPSLKNKLPNIRIGVRGNPNLGMIRTMMTGVKSNEPRQYIKGEVWFNELRLADMDNKGGMAALLNVNTNMADFATVSTTGKMNTIGFGAIEDKPNERSRDDAYLYNIVTNLSLGKLLPNKWGVNLPFNYSVGEEFIKPEYDPFYSDIKLKELLDNTNDFSERKNIENRAIDYTKRRSINFIGVRKEKNDTQKPHIYDVENLTLSQSYNEIKKHDFEVLSNLDQTTNTAVNYAYSFQPKTIEPFKKNKTLSKNNYLKLLSDFNFNYLPSNITFNSNIIRQYNRQEFRLIDVEGIGLSPLYKRNFAFNYQYGFNFNLTKSLKINYTASSNNLVSNYLDQNNMPIDDFSIWDHYFDVGTSNQHNQQAIINYDIPINKIPILNFVKSTISYTGGYSWQRSSIALSQIEDDNGGIYNLGNTIQNSNTINWNTALNMESFYKYIGLTKKDDKKNPSKNIVTAPKPGEKTTLPTKPKKETNENIKNNPFVDGIIGIATSIKNIQINYSENNGTLLPGFLPGLGFFGSSLPSLGFTFGSQEDVRYEAAKKGYLTNYQEFNQNFTQVKNKTLKATANIDLFPDFKIDLNADRLYASNYSEQYNVSSSGIYNNQSPFTTGNYSISTILIKTSFSTNNETNSVAFDKFRENRYEIAHRLAIQNGKDANDLDANGFPKGYGKSNQAVLLPAFLSAYTGSDAKKTSLNIFKDFPLPNWTIKYNGFMRYNFFKDNFKRFSLQHGYRAAYTINSFRSNLEYDKNPGGLDKSFNYLNPTIMSNINLVEQFNPLMRVDFELKNAFRFLTEIKKDRTLSMSFDNNLLTETQGTEYVIGTGYRIKDVIISTRLADNPSGIIKSDINIKADFSFRYNQTIVRNLEYDNNKLASGQNIWSIKLMADYSFSRNLTTIFYYDHSFSKAVISTSFPMTNIRSGITIRYNFGN